MKCVVVVPTYNEAENLERLLQQIHSHAPYAHVILMDDISPDGTADHAEALFLRHPEYANYSVIRRSGQRGLGRAYRDGFQRALDLEYDRIIQMDADLSHDPAYLPALLEACETADIVIGSRYCKGGGVKNWPTHRVMLSKFACWYVQLVGKLPMRDATAGFRCWTRRALQAVEINSLHSEGYSFQVEMGHRASRAGMKIVESPIVFTDRQFGKSKISRAVIFESFLMPWRLRFSPWKPARRITVTTRAEAAPGSD